MRTHHITKDGRSIAIKDLTTKHLINIISRIKRLADSGIIVKYRYGGHGSTADEMWYDETIEHLKGEKVLKYYDYDVYANELKYRENNLKN